MLKTQGINALMVVGDINTPITDITQSNHAWVLAEVSPGSTWRWRPPAAIRRPEPKRPVLPGLDF